MIQVFETFLDVAVWFCEQTRGLMHTLFRDYSFDFRRLIMPHITLENPLPPLWMKYPHISKFSIGWRMGYGEGYKFHFWEWYESLSKNEQKSYQDLFPPPRIWNGFYDPDYDFEEDFYFETIQLWTQGGAPKYSIESVDKRSNSKKDYVFFWKPNPIRIKACFSQWQSSTFVVDTDVYCCGEQYMMAEKARIFEDSKIAAEIMHASEPKEMKALGRKVKNFDQARWDFVKYSVVLSGNYHKFSQNADMRDYLLSTGDKILVEVSPLDTIWGIGYGSKNEKALYPSEWRGENLLGFALMEVRDDLRKVYENYELIDWELHNDIEQNK